MSADATHPAPSTLERYAAGTLGGAERDACEEHLTHCRECRSQVVELYLAIEEIAGTTSWRLPRRVRAAAERLAAPPPVPSRWSWLAGATPRPALAGVAALVIAVVAVAYFGWPRAERPETILRADVAAPAAPEPRAPAAGAVLRAQPIAFAWTPFGEATRYRVTVMDRNGDMVAELAAATPRLDWRSAPGRLVAGETYYWYVTAILVDGSERDSEIQPFRWQGP